MNFIHNKIMKKLIYFFIIPFVFACTSTNKEIESEESTQQDAPLHIELSKEQIDLGKIETGKIKKTKISETIMCTGVISTPPEHIASISPIIEGFVKSINYSIGQKVEKGAILALLQHPDFIEMQKQYIEAKSEMDYFEQEYKRQGELTIENAASIKKMQKAKADYLSAEANYKSLKSNLELLGVDINKIEKGSFEKVFKLIAPISGTISQLNANVGKFAIPNETLYEIINSTNVNINLNVFEKDIHAIQKGQKILFTNLNNTKQFETSVNNIGIKIDTENRTVLVQGKYKNDKSKLKPGMHINASVQIKEQEVNTLPVEAIAEDQSASYVFVKTPQGFEKYQITTGIEQNDFVQIIDLDRKLIESEFVIKGAYYLMSAFELEE